MLLYKLLNLSTIIVLSMDVEIFIMHYFTFTGFMDPMRIYNSCPSSEDIEIFKEDVLQFISSKFKVSLLGLLQQQPADSCDQIFGANPYSMSGLYWIRTNSSIEQMNCTFL